MVRFARRAALRNAAFYEVCNLALPAASHSGSQKLIVEHARKTAVDG